MLRAFVASLALGVTALTALPAAAQTSSHTLPPPVVLPVPVTYSAAAAAARSASSNGQPIPQNPFLSASRTPAERRALLDSITRERYQQAMALNAVRGRGKPIVFKKHRF